MMNESKPLHWSFDHDYGAQRTDFVQSLLKALNQYQAVLGGNAETKQNDKRVYQILPNTWRGYKGRNDELSIGKVVVERKCSNNSIWNYNVQYQNTTSGEDIRFTFSCRDECSLPLHDGWKVDVLNTSGDMYSELYLIGHLSSEDAIQLALNRTEIETVTIDESLPLTCNWALLDAIPQIAKNRETFDSKHSIAILEDLEHLRPICHIGFLDSIQTPMPLKGYYLYGNGLLPSYWWIDSNDTVVIVSGVFETLVLQELSVNIS